MRRGEPPTGPTRNNLPGARPYIWRDPARSKLARPKLSRLLATHELEEAMRRISEPLPLDDVTYTGRVIYACPDCEGDLEEDGLELWCPACETAVSLADLHVDRESDPWF